MHAYETRIQTVNVREAGNMRLRTLADTQQFHDYKGMAARLGVSSAMWPVFGQLWPSSIHLANKVATRELDKKCRILEIGCGLGLASLVAHQRGLQITASDTHPLGSEFLRRNVHLNKLLPLRYKYGRWGKNFNQQAKIYGLEVLESRFDLVIASDVLYEPDMPDELAEFIDQHSEPTAEFWLVDPNRGYAGRFGKALKEHGFELVENTELKEEPTEANPKGFSGRFLRYGRTAAVA